VEQSDGNTEESFQNKAIWWSAAAVAVVALGPSVLLSLTYSQPSAPEKLQEAPPPAPARQAGADTGIQHPIPEAAGAVQSTAGADESDQMVHDSLAGLWAPNPLSSFSSPRNRPAHRRDDRQPASKKKVAVDLRPIKATPGQTVVASQGDINT